MLRQLTKTLVEKLPYRYQNAISYNLNLQIRNKIIGDWLKAGKPVPPPHQVKQVTIEAYRSQSNYQVLVETGTFMGHMINVQRKKFKQLYSIELDGKLWQDATKRFSAYSNIRILQGDSGKVLKDLVPELTEPAIFWLDGHYSGGNTAKGDKDCPIYEELDAIFKAKQRKNILLIDDARLFNGQNDYPTLEQLTTYVKSKDPAYTVSVKDDIIRCVAGQYRDDINYLS